jgi:hypothetical protein
MCTMPKAFPGEFREDVIRVYRDSDSSVAQGRAGLPYYRWLAKPVTGAELTAA